MANQEQRDLLKQGSEVWNTWRAQHPEIRPDLSGADLSKTDLSGANLSGADLLGANLSRVKLRKADLSRANLSRAHLSGADIKETDIKADLSEAILSETNLSEAHLSEAILLGADLSRANLRGVDLGRADLRGADLIGADLMGAYLSGAFLSGAILSGAILSGAKLRGAKLIEDDLSGANLSGADLTRAELIETNLTGAILADCRIYGISIWKAQLEGANQTNLNISDENEAAITVDNLEVAQFLYLLLNNTKIRNVIDIIAKKTTLILGRFNRFIPERKAILDALREELRKQNYIPILFDFEKATDRNYTETVTTLAHLARFIIADLTEPSSIPQELQAIVPTLAVPVQPILLEGKREDAMFVDLLNTYEWVLPIHYYTDENTLVTSLQDKIIKPAEDKAKALEQKRN